MGLGIAAMHYLGMAALEIAPGISYNLFAVGVSLAIAITGSCVALWLAFALRSETVSSVLLKRVGSALVMGIAIAGQERTKFRGCERVGWAFTFAAAAYNLARLPKLMEAA